jgi:2-oxoglutarate ferredoxin oxidoreductase subunit alpha
MDEFSILVGGKAGDGVREMGSILASIMNKMGYRIFVYDDYQSLIRGGHNFSIVRCSKNKIFSHMKRVDVIFALDQNTINKHLGKLNGNGFVIYDSTTINFDGRGIGIPLTSEIKKRKVSPLLRNTMGLGAFTFLTSIPLSISEEVLKEKLKRFIDLNIEILRVGYDYAKNTFPEPFTKIEKLSNSPLRLLTGNEAVALGCVKAGMKIYIAYPMTPATSILHYLAAHEDDYGIITVHPENEIAVAMMGIGASYAGVKTVVGTSGGGFDLMTESMSLAGQSECPILFIVSQRPGPSTGVPTYTMQGDLLTVISAGHGEFLRIVIAPGDVEEAFYAGGLALNLAWKYQTPTILLMDKHLSESTMSAEIDDSVKPLAPKLWKGEEYMRYTITEDGISPLAFPGTEGVVIKANSYEHDEYGITTEEEEKISRMQEKRLLKEKTLLQEMKEMEMVVKVYGEGEKAFITWGSTKGAVIETAEKLKFKVVQPLLLNPFPHEEIKEALRGAEKVIDVEVNATGQLAKLLESHGINVDEKILKYDGRPFTPEEIEERVKEVL